MAGDQADQGTTARGSSHAEDEASSAALRRDPRFRAENLMIVDLLRNDVARVAEPGTVTVPQLMAVQSYPSVHSGRHEARGEYRYAPGTGAGITVRSDVASEYAESRWKADLLLRALRA